ncbi:MAG: mechanosensitive ion channel family protein [Acidobacteriota bacterium]
MRPRRRMVPAVLTVVLAWAAWGLAPGLPAPFQARAQAEAQVPEGLGELLGGGRQPEEEGQPGEEGAQPEERPRILPDRPPERELLDALFDPGTWPALARVLVVRLVEWLPSVLAALIVLVAFVVFHRVLSGVLRRVMHRTRADPAAQEIAGRLTKYLVLGLGLLAAASQLGIQVGSLLAGLGILGLAVGLAAQDSLSNLVAGLTILWDRPFRIGDNVTVSDTFGKVQHIGLRTTRIRTVEQLDTILPNKEIINETIVNHTLNPMMRLGVPLSIAYKEDTREARRVLLEAVRGHELLLDRPEPKVVVTALADSGVELQLRVWLRDPFTEREATFAMLEIAKIALDEAGIEIPFPQRTLHFPGPVPLARSEARAEEG